MYLPFEFRFCRSVHYRCPTGFLADEHSSIGQRCPQTGRATVVNGATETDLERQIHNSLLECEGRFVEFEGSRVFTQSRAWDDMLLGMR